MVSRKVNFRPQSSVYKGLSIAAFGRGLRYCHWSPFAVGKTVVIPHVMERYGRDYVENDA